MTTTKTKKVNFTGKKEAFQLVDIDVDKIFVSIKEPYGTKNALKYFIEYNDDAVIRSLCLQLPQMTKKNVMKMYQCFLGLITNKL